MTAYQCLRCNTVHGWGDHPSVTKVKRHIRYPGEDVWYCPSCNREHRTTDGTMFGQIRKLWKEVDPDNIESEQEEFIVFGDGFAIRRSI